MNVYRAPKAEVADRSPEPRAARFLHSLAAFGSAIALGPLILYAAAYLFAGNMARVPISIDFWGIALLGASLAAAIVYPMKTPMWSTAVLGALASLAVFIAAAVWIDLAAE